MTSFNIDQYEITYSLNENDDSNKCDLYSVSNDPETVVSMPLPEVNEQDIYRWLIDHFVHQKNVNFSSIALIEEIGESRCVTYEELITGARKTANYMKYHGVRPGDRVLFCMENSSEYVFYLAGILILGAVPLLVNPSHIVMINFDNVNCTSAVVDLDNYQQFLQFPKQNPLKFERIFVISDDITAIKIPRHVWILDGYGFLSFSSVFELEQNNELPISFALFESDNGYIAHSRKSVSAFCENFYNNFFQELPNINNDNHLISSGFHNYSSFCYLLHVFSKGQTCILAESYQEVWRASFIDRIAELIEQYKISVLFTNAHFLKCLVKYDMQNIFELNSLKVIINLGPAVSISISKKLGKLLHMKLFQAYSSVEFGIACYGAVEDDDCNVLASCGFPKNETKIKIANPTTGKEVGNGKWGEIVINGSQLFCERLESESVIKTSCKTWYKTGDYGRIDENDVLHFHGPISELLDINNKKVSSELIESIFSMHKLVDDTVVMQNKYKLCCGLLLKHESECPTSANLETMLKTHDIYIGIDKIVILDFIPRSENGTILRGEIPYLMNTDKTEIAHEENIESSI